MTTTPDENRPYSTAYGLGSTDTESIASSGSVKRTRPVDGSASVVDPICVPDWAGRPPRMLRPLGTSMTLASRRSAPCSPLPGARRSVSLLSIAADAAIVSALETIGVGATTVTESVRFAMGRSTFSVAATPAATTARAAKVTNPSNDTITSYLPGGRFAIANRPSPSLRMFARSMPEASRAMMVAAPSGIVPRCVDTIPSMAPVAAGAWTRGCAKADRDAAIASASASNRHDRRTLWKRLKRMSRRTYSTVLSVPELRGLTLIRVAGRHPRRRNQFTAVSVDRRHPEGAARGGRPHHPRPHAGCPRRCTNRARRHRDGLPRGPHRSPSGGNAAAHPRRNGHERRVRRNEQRGEPRGGARRDPGRRLRPVRRRRHLLGQSVPLARW